MVVGSACGAIVTVVGLLVYFRQAWLPPRTSSLDGDVPHHIKAYVHHAIARALRDPVGRPDLALYSDGGRVLPGLTSTVQDEEVFSIPTLSLTDDTRIGECWNISGTTAQLGIKLAHGASLTHVTIDHIPKEIAMDIGCAPRSMLLWGAIDGRENRLKLEEAIKNHNFSVPASLGRSQPLLRLNFDFALLASIEYDISSPSNIQTFALEQYAVQSGVHIGVVVLEILDNWGGERTFLYRVRIHGELAPPPA